MNTDHVDHHACRRLWASVLLQAAKDALEIRVATSQTAANLRETRRARSWLLSGAPGVAQLAGLEEEAVRRWAVAQAAAGWSQRATVYRSRIGTVWRPQAA